MYYVLYFRMIMTKRLGLTQVQTLADLTGLPIVATIATVVSERFHASQNTASHQYRLLLLNLQFNNCKILINLLLIWPLAHSK